MPTSPRLTTGLLVVLATLTTSGLATAQTNAGKKTPSPAQAAQKTTKTSKHAAMIAAARARDSGSVAWIAGHMDVGHGEINSFRDIENATFSCALIPSMKTFLQGLQGQGQLAAMTSGQGAISLDKEGQGPWFWLAMTAQS